MAERITGSFPGGPTRADTTPRRRGPVRTRSVEVLEEARAARTFRRRRTARRRRVVWGFVLSLAAAGAAGVYLGMGSHVSPTELSVQAEEARARDFDISREVNRTLLELWRMEELEARRSMGGPR